MGLKRLHRWSVGRLVYFNGDDDGQDGDEYCVDGVGDGYLKLCAQINIAR